MTIVLYKNNSDINYLDKNLELIDSLTGSLRGECSVTDPTILIESEYVFANVNYFYIPEFNRYYYVKSITSVNTNLWLISGHVDVLGTYKEAIRANDALVTRQQNLYNLYLDDDRLHITSRRLHATKTFPGGPAIGTGGSVVIILAGG